METQLDKTLNRKKPDAIWQHEAIKGNLAKHSQNQHIFVVLASPVAEVGRDHDYDWAIVEPSSMRSIIQLAGRVLRHRDHAPETANILLLNKNYKAMNPLLKKASICFEKPGFETQETRLSKNELATILDNDQYQHINAIPRITLPEKYRKEGEKYLNLVELEHKALANQLLVGSSPASVWWKNNPHWCGEVQRQQKFRQSKQDEAYYLWLTDEYSSPVWLWKNEHVYPAKFGEGNIAIIPSPVFPRGDGVYFWFDLSAKSIYSELAKDFNIDLPEVSRLFGEVRLIEYDDNQHQAYNYHPNLGLYKEIVSTTTQN